MVGTRSIFNTGQGRWPRIWARGCAQRSGMSLRAARALCIALHNPALCADRANWAQMGPIAGTVCRARKMQKVYWYITFYTS